MLRHHYSKGFLLIEMVVTISVVLVVVASILVLYRFVFSSERRENNQVQARLYAQEALEAVDFAARYDWNLMTDGVWHPEIIDGVWQLMSGAETLGIRYTRTITIDSLERSLATNGHAYGEIVAAGGTIDPETKLVTVEVSWQTGTVGIQSVSYTTYKARDWSVLWKQNDWSGGAGQQDWVDNTRFSVGNNIDITVPGVLALAGNFITWDNATTTAEVDLPGNVNATSIFVLGSTLFIGTENNSAGGNHEFYAYDITDLNNPILYDSIELNADINGIYADGSYAALATSANSAEIQVLDISDINDLQLVESADLSTNLDANDIGFYNDHLYVIRGTDFFTYDYSDPLNIVETDILYLGEGVLNALSVQGNKAYVASTIDSQELAIIDITDPSNAQHISGYDLPGNRQGTDVYAFGFYAHIVTSNDGSAPEFYTFSIGNPFDPQLLGTYEVGEKVAAVSALSNLAFIGSNLGGDDVLVLDVSDPASIFIDTGYEIKGTATAVHPTPEAIYLATTSNDSELIIISVGSNVPLYPSSGYLETSTFDTTSPTSTINWINWLGHVPSATTVKFQIASNNDNSTWNFVGPDGTSGSFYTSQDLELINYDAHLNTRYLRYAVTLESADQEQTPFIYDIGLSYSS